MKKKLVGFSVDHPVLIVILTLAFLAGTVGLGVFRGFSENWDIVDTDPENMLSPKELVRIFHNETKQEFSLHDMIVLGIANEEDPDGVFNPETLGRVDELTQYIKGLDGVISADVIAPSEVDNIEQAGPSAIRFERLMEEPPGNREEARRIRDNARNHPMLYGTLVSEDGKALCIYVPLREKKLSHQTAAKIREKAEDLGLREMTSSSVGPEGNLKGEGDFYGIAGLPVAEDTFGVEMFTQMAVSAPLAMLVIFILLFIFFRKITLILSPMIVAMFSVFCTMGLLIGLGYTVHIMSSMIPIFLMPIAVVDSVHILSEFYDRYRSFGDTRKTILAVMDELFTPMLYTSLTSAAGFASLALTPIPPVQVFGLFVACGIMLAWILTIIFIPAYMTFIPTSSLKTFGVDHEKAEVKGGTLLGRGLAGLGRFTFNRAKAVIVVTFIIIAVSAYGISRIRINDNPTKWFVESHPIRVADLVLNSHFGGTYMAYLILERAGDTGEGEVDAVRKRMSDYFGSNETLSTGVREESKAAAISEFNRLLRDKGPLPAVLEEMADWSLDRADASPEKTAAMWEAFTDFIGSERARADLFKRPEMLLYIDAMEREMKKSGVVGKSSSAATLVKHIHRELKSGKPTDFIVPERPRMVAECYIQAQSGHDPEDVWHLVTPDYKRANIWVQLKSGDNRDMEMVTMMVDEFLAKNPPPVPLTHRWAGLTYVNVEWQSKMVTGMIRSLLGSFVIVLIMMVFLFRSFIWGLLCMVPLSVTIAFIYGLIGFAGKDYDMPVAILSSLTLGLSVDFAIHYLQRSREIFARTGNWRDTAREMSGEPARAITRNAIVIAIGFLPLLAASLVPYKTVGFFLATIMAVSGMGTLMLLPSLVMVLQRALFVPKAPAVACNCAVCAATGIVAVGAVAFALHHYNIVGWTGTTIVAAVLVVVGMVVCNRLARREACRREEE